MFSERLSIFYNFVTPKIHFKLAQKINVGTSPVVKMATKADDKFSSKWNDTKCDLILKLHFDALFQINVQRRKVHNLLIFSFELFFAENVVK